jgi:CO dehydrogenase/acetyl-CoA synthase beta subunit
MRGKIVNKSTMWMHAMKRAVAPGGAIPLDELYDQYGKKHDINAGEEFIAWLKNVKLKNNTNWQIILETEETKAEEAKEESPPIEERRIDITKINPKKMEIAEVVSLSVRQAREVLPMVSDIKLLKYALQEAHPRAGKDSLCRILRKRISELETIRR